MARHHPDSGERRLDLLRWGLIPHFTKDLKTACKPINARSETAPRSGMFRGALKARRCLVPVDALYEWKTMGDGKQPSAIAREDGAPMAVGGTWESWRGADGEVKRTFAIMTTAANQSMQRLHDRMPVILEPAHWPAWLGESEADPEAPMRPAGGGLLRLWPVSRAVNNVRNNGAELLDRIDDPPLRRRVTRRPETTRFRRAQHGSHSVYFNVARIFRQQKSICAKSTVAVSLPFCHRTSSRHQLPKVSDHFKAHFA